MGYMYSRIEVTTTRNCPVHLGMWWTPFPILFPKEKTPRNHNLSQHKKKNKNVVLLFILTSQLLPYSFPDASLIHTIN